MHRQAKRAGTQAFGTVSQQVFVWAGAYGGTVHVMSSLLQYQVRPLGDARRQQARTRGEALCHCLMVTPSWLARDWDRRRVQLSFHGPWDAASTPNAASTGS